MIAAFTEGCVVRARGGVEQGRVVRYDHEDFYIVDVERDGELVRLVVHQDDLELVEESEATCESR